MVNDNPDSGFQTVSFFDLLDKGLDIFREVETFKFQKELALSAVRQNELFNLTSLNTNIDANTGELAAPATPLFDNQQLLLVGGALLLGVVLIKAI